MICVLGKLDTANMMSNGRHLDADASQLVEDAVVLRSHLPQLLEHEILYVFGHIEFSAT